MHLTRPLAAGVLALAGLFFAAYPALRPYSDETTLAGAEAMASGAWVASHTLGMVGFLTLTLGLWALARMWQTRGTAAAVALTWLGTGLVLPYYGAEAFGLHVIGERAAATDDASLLELADAFRYGTVPVTMFGAGLLALAAAGVVLAVSLRRADGLLRFGAVLTGVGLVTYLPQFFLPPGLRIVHGVLLGLGCLVMAAACLRLPRCEAEPPG